ncbi:MAG: FG-GAP-like repeat-containing protein, partial [Planctomycetota bacterium]
MSKCKHSTLTLSVLLLVAVCTAATAADDAQEEARNLASEGRRLLSAGEEDQALASFRAALKLAPDLPLAHEGVGLILFRRGDLPGSLEALNRAVAGDPDSCLSRGALARTQHAAGDVAAATQSLKEAMRRDAACIPARVFLANLYEARGEFARSASVLAEVNKLAPQSRRAALQRAEVLHRAGRLTEAIGVLAALPTGDPEERVVILMVEMRMRMRRYAEAEDLLRNYLHALLQQPLTVRNPEAEAEARELLARLLFETGRYGPASREAEVALAADPERPIARYTLGKSLYMQGQMERGLVEINRARQIIGDAPLEALSDLSVIYRRPSSQPADAFLRDVAPQLGLADGGKGRGSTWEDLDGDGALDLVVGGQEFASVAFLRVRDAQARVVFREATDSLGIGDYDSGYTNLVGDLNGDGRMDVYGLRGGYQSRRDGRDGNVLLLNQGDSGGARPRFRRAGPEHGADDPGQGFGGALADFDGDGDLDLYIANHNDPNRLLLNDGKAMFRDVSEAAGVAHPGGGQGVAVGDVDDDGDIDVFVANKHHQRIEATGPGSVLYRNDGVGEDGIPRFTEIARQAGLEGNGNDFAPLLADLDNDGDLDLFVGAFNYWNGKAFISWDGSPGGAHRLY